jgi:16S rRNA (adenine1518-N6/adenine1519-N6)-dimethyltransferase
VRLKSKYTKIERDARTGVRVNPQETPAVFIDISSRLAYIDFQLASMLAPKKSLGQNFLRDQNIARKIVDSLHAHPSDVILEIGPGQGDLTRLLFEVSSTVVGVELDPRAAGILKERFGPALHLLEQDVLSVNLKELAMRFGQDLCIVGNIPYYITSEILFWLFDQRDSIRHATLTMQWEVAARLVAHKESKAYGILSVFSQLYADTKLLFKVSRNSFHPRPQVDSAVVRFEFGKRQAPADERLLRNIVRCTFGTRRKTIRNGLRMMGFSEQQLDEVVFDFTKRPEQLSPSEFVHLSSLLARHAASLSMKY